MHTHTYAYPEYIHIRTHTHTAHICMYVCIAPTPKHVPAAAPGAGGRCRRPSPGRGGRGPVWFVGGWCWVLWERGREGEVSAHININIYIINTPLIHTWLRTVTARSPQKIATMRRCIVSSCSSASISIYIYYINVYVWIRGMEVGWLVDWLVES